MASPSHRCTVRRAVAACLVLFLSTACGSEGETSEADALGADSSCREFMAAPETEQDVAVNIVATELEVPDAVTPEGRPLVNVACAGDADLSLEEAVGRAGGETPAAEESAAPEEDELGDARDAVLAQGGAAAATILAYDAATLDQDRSAATALMTDSFAELYTDTFDDVVAPAAEQSNASVTAEVLASSITAMSEDSVVLLLFVDQATTSDSNQRPQLALNRVTLEMVDSGAGAWLVDDVTADGRASAADPDPERMAAMEAAEGFTEAWNTFDADSVDSYLSSVPGMLTTKFADEFRNAADNIASGIREQRLSSSAEVLQTGVASLDEDSAEVLVSADARRSSEGQKTTRHWRWQVSLAKVDGEWLVDSFQEI